MKSVQVQLDTGWAKEEWKIRRLFASSISIEEDETHSKISVTIRPFPGVPEKGYPEDLRLSFDVSQQYMHDEIVPDGVLFTKVESLHALYPLPLGFAVKYITSLNQECMTSLFRVLQRADRSICEIWKQCVSAYFNTNEKPLHGVIVNKIFVPHITIFQISHIVTDLSCLNCGNRQLNHTLLGPNVSYSFVCQGCMKDLHVAISRSLEVHGHKCAIANVTCISGWTNLCEFTEFRDPVLEILVDLPKIHHPTITTARTYYKPGTSLPCNGACKHYKKSFRWLQYPCCQDWFACNQCHEIKCQAPTQTCRTMMCGFCSAQQPIAPTCTGCDRELAPNWSAKERVEPSRPRRRKKR